MKLTIAQKKLIEKVKTADDIIYGVIWYATYNKRKYRHETLDGRVCNSLVKKGVLVPIGDNKYKLSLGE